MNHSINKMFFCCLLLLIIFSNAFTQKSITFYKPTIDYYGERDTILTMDFSHIVKPQSLESFNPLFHFPPVRQDTTGTCWAFSTTSFLESELVRLGKEKVKLSEIFIAYHEYIEKARRFVQRKGDSVFEQGSEENGAIQRIKQYGIVRASDYSGLLPGVRYHAHDKMHTEMINYLDFIKAHNYWDEDIVINQIKLIMNKYLGAPPAVIIVDGTAVTPLEYARDILQLPLDAYVDFMSFTYAPFYTKGEYKVEDNWWHSKDYYNVPLNEWYDAIKKALQRGFTVAIGGDVSEVGKCGEEDLAIIPPFDIPPENINQDVREFRFDNESSADDHAVHIVGYQKYKGKDWFLVKDSGYSATKGKFKGYYFFREDYVKLKMLTFTVHQDAVQYLLKKF